jgi:hypothetical protein
MKQQVQCCMTAGVAIVGAGVIAVAPIAPLPSEEVRSTHQATVNLLAATTPNELLAALQDVNQVPQDLPIGEILEALVNIADGFANSAVRLAEFQAELPLRVFELATEVVTGDLTPAEGLALLLITVVNAPTEIAEPALAALIANLPEPIGGAEGLVAGLQQGALDTTQAIIEVITGILLPDDGVQAVAQVQQDISIGDVLDAVIAISAGFAESAVLLAEFQAELPLRVFGLATDVLTGELTPAEGLAALLTGLAEAPIEIANPALFALIDNLPGPIGGDEGLVAGVQGLGADLTDTLVEAINNILLPDDNVLAVAQVEQDDPIGDVLARLTNIRNGFAESGEVLSMRLDVAPEFFRELAADVANGDVGPAQALRLVGVRLINGAYLGDDVSPGVLRPATDALVDNVPEPVGGEDGVIDTADERATEVATDIRDTIAGGDEVNRVPEGGNTFVKLDATANSRAGADETPPPADEKEEEVDDADNGTKAPVIDMKSGNKAEPGANRPSTSGPRKGAVKAVGDQLRTTVNNVVQRVTGGNTDNSGDASSTDNSGGTSNTADDAGSGEDDAG